MTNLLVESVKQKIGAGYWWGGEGEYATPELLEQFIAWYGGKSHYYLSDGTSAEQWFGNRVYDCSGLIRQCLIEIGVISQESDISAQGFYYGFCSPITRDELKPGDLCFIQNDNGITHVAIYVGGGQIVEARGTKWGVVMDDLRSGFNVFGRLNLPLEVDEPEAHDTILNAVAAIDFLARVGKISEPELWKSVIQTDVIKYLDVIFIKWANDVNNMFV